MRFEEFLNERKYLLNVSHKTLVYYRCAFNSWEKHKGYEKPATWIKNMLESGIKPVSVNTYICAMNAYWKWEGAGIKLKYIKEEEKILATLSANHVAAIIRYKAVGTNLLRAHMAALTILDCGLRASEVTGLKRESLDFENLCFRVKGKGGKERLVPISLELRKLLFKVIHSPVNNTANYIFGTKNGTRVSVRNLERDFGALGKTLGITGVRFSPHTLRHTFAVSYLRKGGNLFYLSRILGHMSIKTTERYLQSLGIEDLQAVHNQLSLLSR